MSDDKDDNVHMVPPLADLSGRDAPVPGPLTKPVAIPRPPSRRRPRWTHLVLLLLALAAAAGFIWWLSL